METHIKTVKFASLSSMALMMAAISGFADVIGFVGVNRLFTAHITGNIVIAIAEIIHHESGVAAKLIAIPFFILIAAFTTWIIEMQGQTKRLLAIWFIIEALFLTAFMFTGIYILPFYEFGSWQYICCAMLPVCAMAIHNILLRTFMCTLPPCTVMTGNLSQLIVDSVSYVWRKTLPYNVEKTITSHAGIQRFGNVIIGFLIGGACAAFGFSAIGFWIIPLSVIALLFMAKRTLHHSS